MQKLSARNVRFIWGHFFSPDPFQEVVDQRGDKNMVMP